MLEERQAIHPKAGRDPHSGQNVPLQPSRTPMMAMSSVVDRFNVIAQNLMTLTASSISPAPIYMGVLRVGMGAPNLAARGILKPAECFSVPRTHGGRETTQGSRPVFERSGPPLKP